MTSILLVEDDEHLRSAVARDLGHRGFTVTPVGSVDAALETLDSSEFDVVLTDLRMTEKDGLDLLAMLNEVAPSTRSILMSAYATARDHQKAMELGAVQVLCKPFTSSELMQAIRQAVECERGFRGSVHGLSLVDMLQMFHYARRSISVIVGGPVRGEIHVEDGDIVHATRGDREGEEALRQILEVPSGSVQTSGLSTKKRTIERSFQSLLLDVLRMLDEEKQPESAAGDSLSFDEWSEESPTAVSQPTPSRRQDGLADACERVVDRVSGALACGVVELASGKMLSCIDRSGRSLETELTDAVVALYTSVHAHELDELVGGVPSTGTPVQEVRMVSKNDYHFTKLIDEGRSVLVLVTRRDSGFALAWATLKASIPRIEQCLR